MDPLTYVITRYPVQVAVAVLLLVFVALAVRWWRRMFSNAADVRIGKDVYRLTMRDIRAIYASMDEMQRLAHESRMSHGGDPLGEPVFLQAAIRYLRRTGRWRD